MPRRKHFRCALATAVAENVDAIAGDALNGWTGDKGWAALIEKPGGDNPVYRTQYRGGDGDPESDR